MQVANSSQLSTSATLGAKKAMAVTITDNAAFFNVMFSTLYSNQKLALIREILCNAWDIHIESGRTHIPVIVEISADGELSITDHGWGIHPDKMEETYCVMGGSTKTDNDMVTGGFGLGCKSPWAYVDSFRVISCHAGMKTVYNAVKSCVENAGRPAMLPITSIPTEDTGLTVTLPMQERDIRQFINYIDSVVYTGEMNVEFIDHRQDDAKLQRLNTLNMSFAPGSYAFDDDGWYQDHMGYGNIFIRYGNVVYPALDVPETKSALQLIQRFMSIVGLNRILVQAAPSTLAISPSRETLSSQQMTIDGIVDACTSLVNTIEKDIKKLIPAQIEEIKTLLTTKSRWGNWANFRDNCWASWYELPQSNMVTKYLKSNMGAVYRRHYFGQLKNAELQGHLDSLGLLGHPLESRIRHALYKSKNLGAPSHLRKLMHRYGTKPVLLTVGLHKKLEFKKLRLLATHHGYPEILNKKLYDVYSKHHSNGFSDNIKLVTSKLVFVTNRLRDVRDSIRCYPEVKEHGSSYSCWIYYVNSKKPEAKDIPIKAFTDAGFTVVDLTLKHEWDSARKFVEQRAVVAAKQGNTKVKSANGLVPLRNIAVFDTTGNLQYFANRSIDKLGDNWTGQCDNPIFYVDSAAVQKNALGQLGKRALITDHMLDNCVVVRNGIERRMAEKRGGINVDAYFIGPMLKVAFSKEMHKYLTKERERDIRDVYELESQTFKMLRDLGIKVPGKDKLRHDPKLEAILTALHDLRPANLLSGGVITQDECTELNSILHDVHLIEFAWIKQIKTMLNDTLLHRLDVQDIRDIVSYYPERKAALRSLVLSALKRKS